MAFAKPRKWFPKNPAKYVGDPYKIRSRSSWERMFMNTCDTSSSIIKWNSEDVVVSYISPKDGKPHRYFVDFWIKYIDKQGNTKTALVEVKPFHQTVPPKKKNDVKSMVVYAVNLAKWEAAKKVADASNCEWMLLHEYNLGIKKL